MRVAYAACLQYGETPWTLWDRFDVAGPLTLKAFIKHFADEHKLEVRGLLFGVAQLYASYWVKDKLEARLEMPCVGGGLTVMRGFCLCVCVCE